MGGRLARGRLLSGKRIGSTWTRAPSAEKEEDNATPARREAAEREDGEGLGREAAGREAAERETAEREAGEGRGREAAGREAVREVGKGAAEREFVEPWDAFVGRLGCVAFELAQAKGTGRESCLPERPQDGIGEFREELPQ